MNQMRELFEKWAKSECLDTGSVDGFYSDNDTHIAWGSWQAAQSVSVPVVGDVVAWADPRHLSMVRPGIALTGIYLSGMETPDYPTPLIVQPATSISAAELDALRRDAGRYRAVRHFDLADAFQERLTEAEYDARVDVGIAAIAGAKP